MTEKVSSAKHLINSHCPSHAHSKQEGSQFIFSRFKKNKQEKVVQTHPKHAPPDNNALVAICDRASWDYRDTIQKVLRKEFCLQND
jgi:hypothetical protein